MRLMDEYFVPKSLDLVISNAALHFLNEEDQLKTVAAIRNVLKDDGRFFVVHYHDDAHHTVEDFPGFKAVRPDWINFLGPIFLYEKS